MWLGVTMPQYSQRFARPQPRRFARCSGRRVQPTAAGLSLPLGRHKSTGSVISARGSCRYGNGGLTGSCSSVTYSGSVSSTT